METRHITRLSVIPKFSAAHPCSRAPAQTLIDYLAGGDGKDEILEQFPAVSRQQAQAALRVMSDALLAAS